MAAKTAAGVNIAAYAAYPFTTGATAADKILM
jgi:hypothetical protein